MADNIQASSRNPSVPKIIPFNEKTLAADSEIDENVDYDFKRNLEIELSVNFDSFSNEDIIMLIEELEKVLNLSKKINILLKEKGSILLTIEMDGVEANKLVEIFNSGKLIELNIHKIKIKRSIVLEESTPAKEMTFEDRIRNYKKMLELGKVKTMLENLQISWYA